MTGFELPFRQAWLFPGRLPESCRVPPECRPENRDLRIPRRLDQMEDRAQPPGLLH